MEVCVTRCCHLSHGQQGSILKNQRLLPFVRKYYRELMKEERRHEP